jgi:hypothetical protein
VFLISSLLFANSALTFSQSALFKNKANFATLILNYKSFEFEGGNLSGYDCIDCKNDSMPVICFSSRDGSDLNYLGFYLISTSQNIFYSSIIWMGVGTISTPENFTKSGLFEKGSTKAQKPESFRFVNPFMNVYFPIGISQNLSSMELNNDFASLKKDSIWGKIDSLNIFSLFAGKNYHAITFPYYSARGFSDVQDQIPFYKWIVLLYYYDGINTDFSLNAEKFSVFPTTVSNTISIKSNIYNDISSKYQIYDLMGKCIKSDYFKNSELINISDLPPGLFNILIFENDILKYQTKFIKN